jgi:hypothetical protein
MNPFVTEETKSFGPVSPVAPPKIISHFQRFEIKYQLSSLQAERLYAELAASHMHPDPRVAEVPSGRYTVSSLYFDSPELMCWQANEAGLRRRFKLRIRAYAEPGEPVEHYFLEVKKKDDAVVTKDRVALPPHLFREAFDNESFDFFRLIGHPEIVGDKKALEEFVAKLTKFRMHPISLVSYKRAPLVGRANEQFRVTIDEDIRAGVARSLDDVPLFIPVFRGRVILEVKFNNTLPYWFHEILMRHGLRRAKFSKYYNGVTLLKEYSRIPRINL